MSETDLFYTKGPKPNILDGCPNPKPSLAEKRAFGRVGNLYTAFSSEFAEFAIDACASLGHHEFLDPFCGMGTLGEAARKRSISLTLADLSPFAILATLVRTLDREQIENGIIEFEKLKAPAGTGDERSIYKSIIAMSEENFSISKNILLENPLQNVAGAVVLFLIALSRIRLHSNLRGSNPTWTKRATHENIDIGRIIESHRNAVSILKDYQKKRPNLASRSELQLTQSDIRKLEIKTESVDAIITSPPYPNRTDYFHHFLPAIEILIDDSPDSERALRESQIGTPLIRRISPSVVLPKRVTHYVDSIRSHPSYASKSYYSKGFFYYFADMQAALSKLSNSLRTGGVLILITQDTYYKDLHVPVVELLSELAMEAGLKPAARVDWKVKQHLSNLSPHSRQAAPNRVLIESVVAFNK